MLLHDFCHYAIEAEPLTQDGFYGRLAAGSTLAQLRDPEILEAPSLLALENRVVRLQTAFRKGLADEGRATARLRQVWGAWQKVRPGQALCLSWPPSAPEVRTDP